MKTLCKQLGLVLLVLSRLGNAACTTMQSIHASEDALTRMNIRPGDKVVLNYTNGAEERIKVERFDDKEISGIADDGRVVVADYNNIISMDHKEVEVLKSAGATVGVVALGAVLVGAVAVGAAAGVAGGM